MNLYELQNAIIQNEYHVDLWEKAKAGDSIHRLISTGEDVLAVSDFFAMLPHENETRRYPFDEVVDFIDAKSENFIN